MRNKHTISNFYYLPFLVGLFFIFQNAPTVLAATPTTSTFNPNLIITDDEMQNYTAMNRNDVSQFLDSKASYLRQYQTEDLSGETKPASEIIYDAAQTYKVNPKYILVTLQKEQSLITDQTPSQKQLDWAAGYGVCDNCAKDDPKIQKFKGFAKQVDNAAGIIRWYYDNTDHAVVKQKNETIKIDDQIVQPQSWATAFLYTYTPHLHGNENFKKIWDDWFCQNYPNNTILRAVGSDEYWIIQDGTRRKFKNMSALLSRSNPKLAVVVPEEELQNYPAGKEIGLPNYSILKNGSNYYLIDYYTIRPFASENVVKKLGYNPQEIIEVSDDAVASYTMGETITEQNANPTGLVVYFTDLKEYYLLKDNTLRPIVSKLVVDCDYKDLPKENHTQEFLKNYKTSNVVVSFKNGTLLTAENSYYVVEDGKKRLIPDEKTFLAMGYKKTNVIKADAMTALVIPDGERIYLKSGLENNNSYLLNQDKKIENLFSTPLPAYVVAKYPSGEIIAGKSTTTSRPLASLTKLLTAYEALELNYNFKAVTTYDSKKYDAYGNYLKITNGEKIRNRDIFNTMLVRSINNMARMVAQGTGYSEKSFLEKLKAQIEDWQLSGTKIEEVTGLSEKNVSTPMDLLAIFEKALSKEEIKTAIGTANYSFTELLDKNGVAKHAFENSNSLLTTANSAYKVIASKTGYTNEGGACLAMLIESKTDKQQYIVITMGDKNYEKRFVEPDKLAKWASQKNYLKIASLK